MVSTNEVDHAVYAYLQKEYTPVAKAFKKALKVKDVPTSDINLAELVDKAAKEEEEEDSEDSDDSDDSDTEGEKKESKDESDAEESSDDSSDSDEEEPAKGEKKEVTKKDDDDESSEEDEDEESSDDSDDDEEETKDTKMEDAKKDSDDDSSDSSDDDDEDEEEEEDKEEEKTASKKRKLSESEGSDKKKTKTEATDANATAILFCGGISWNIDEDGLFNFFGEAGFEAKSVRIITDRDSGRSKGFGYVEFEDAATGEKCKNEMNGKECDGRPLRLDFSEPKAPRTNNDRGKFEQRELKPPTTTIFVGNLSFDAGNDELGTVFEGCEDLICCRVATNREDGSSRGFGYAQFNTVDGAKAAMETVKGAEYNGRALRLDFAEERNREGASPRGRGGRGGSRGGGRGGDRGGRGRGGARGGRGRGGSSGFGRPQGSKMTFD